MTLTIRPYQGERDLQPIADLINLCIAHDHEDGYRSANDLQLAFTAPDVNPAEDIRLWVAPEGHVLGYAHLWIPDPSESAAAAVGHLGFRLHPDVRGKGLEKDLFAWAGDRTLAVARSQDCAAQLRVSCRDDRHDLLALYAEAGFEFERRFVRMGRSLAEPIPNASLPEGFSVISGDQIDVAAWVEMHNQTFIDHWNFHPLTVEQANHYLTDPEYRPELDLVAIAPDGTYAAFCYSHIYEEENRAFQRQTGWINILGTRRGYRRLGLGRAMLLMGLQRLQAASMTTALLGVDSQNPNQAYQLYDAVGFQKRFASSGYVKPLS